MNRTVREFYKAVEGVKTKKTGGYDVQATVRRVEDGVAWVHIPDGVDETPARLTINAKEGDVVQVRIVNGRAFLVGNASAPPTDNTEAIKALSQADVATQAAAIARLKAEEATTDAARAHAAADAAQESADDAAQAAGNAQTSATTANTAANNALQGLSTVESVVDVVNWFNEHKTASTDTTVDPSKTYYSYDAQTGALTKLDPDGTEDPSALGWYEMSDAVADYVATHVATTADGLSVLSAANGWRVLISSGGGNYSAGIYMIDPNGNIAQQTTINGVEFNTGRAVKIGDQTAYINFDGNGNINVIGANMTIGGQNNQNGVLTVKDALNYTIGTWDNTGFQANTIDGYFKVDRIYGKVTLNTTKEKPFIIENASYGRAEYNCERISMYNVNSPDDPSVYISGSDGRGYIGIYSNTSADNGIFLRGSYSTSTDGDYPVIILRGSTIGSNSLYSRNPRIEFQNAGNSQVLGLIFTDYDTVQSPASLTLAGNQGGEYFIAPNIEATSHIYAVHSDSSEVRVKVKNSLHEGNLTVNNSGLFCLYSVTNRHILIQDDANGVVKVRCPNGMYCPVGTTDTDGSRVGAFQTPSATTLRVYAQKGTAGASYGGYITFTGTSSSDIRLKDNIKPVEVKALPLINSIEMKSFDWIEGQRSFKHQPIGMIADQIERLDSRLVMGGGYDSDGTPNYKVIDDHYLICYLTKAVQELSAEIERMKAS